MTTAVSEIDLLEAGLPHELSRTLLAADGSPAARTLTDESSRAEEKVVDMSLDTYNMFFLAKIGSQGFFYSLGIVIIKWSLYILLAYDYSTHHKLATNASNPVKLAQLFLMPVAIVMQEELLTSFFIFSYLKYHPSVKTVEPKFPGAHRWSK